MDVLKGQKYFHTLRVWKQTLHFCKKPIFIYATTPDYENPGQAFHSNFNSHSRGTAILHKRVQFSSEQVISDPSGCYIIVFVCCSKLLLLWFIMVTIGQPIFKKSIPGTTHPSTDWCQIEAYLCNSISLSALICGPLNAHPAKVTSNPIVLTTIKILKQFRQHLKLTSLSPLMPFCENHLFLPAALDSITLCGKRQGWWILINFW